MSRFQLGSSTSAFSTPSTAASSSSRPLPDMRGFGSTPNRTMLGTPNPSRPPATPARQVFSSRAADVEKVIYSSAKKAMRGSPRAVSPVDGSASVTMRKRLKDARYGGDSGGTALGASSSSSLVPPTSPLREMNSQAYGSEEDEEAFGLDDDGFEEEDYFGTTLPEIPKYSHQFDLGKGHSSTVFAAKCEGVPNEIFAIKTMRTGTMKHEELVLWDMLSHPNLVRFYRAWHKGPDMYVLMQYCEGGTLYDYVASHVKEKRRVSLLNLLVAFRDCTSGLHHMHSKGLVHMDFKPSNVCLRKGRAMLCDFNLICKVHEIVEEPPDKSYQAKEMMLQSLNYLADPAADIFALGISFLELMMQEELPKEGEPWHDLRDLPLYEAVQKIHNDNVGYVNDLEDQFGILLKLVAECMQSAAESRPTAALLNSEVNKALIALYGEAAKQVRLVPLSEDPYAVTHANRPESAGLYVSSPRESVTPRMSSTGTRGPSPFFPIARSPAVSRAASRNASPFPRVDPSWANVVAAASSMSGSLEDQMSTSNVDVLTVRLSQTVVTPRATTPLVFAQSSRASSPRPFTSSPPPFLYPGGLPQPVPSIQSRHASPQRPRSLAPTATQ